jgi:phosphate transport system ATP-binding protein
MAGSVQVSGLHVSYGANDVVRGIDLELLPGTVTAIIGPSGCGKSTVLRCLNRLSDLTAGCQVDGSITLDGDDIFRMDPVRLRRRVGMVFQKPNPFPMSIRENVVYGVRAQGGFKGSFMPLVESSLASAALWDEVRDRLQDSGTSLSLGQQQRLCIARALAVSPEVMLMDEPAASLDPISTLALEQSIMAMKGKYTVAIVTHDMHEAQRVADFTVFMYGGKIVEQGETRHLFESPQRSETREYLSGQIVTGTRPEEPVPSVFAPMS